MKVRVPLSVAEPAAAWLARSIRACSGPIFSRVEVAGSIRRRKPEVGDIEIVAEGTTCCRPDTVRGILHSLRVRRGEPNKIGAAAPWGERYYRGVLPLSNGREIGLDLFVVLRPAQWGVIYAIRTGSAEFSKAVVTRLHRYGLRSEQGCIFDVATGKTLPCSTETDFFRYAHLPWIPPELRDIREEVARLAFSGEWESNRPPSSESEPMEAQE